jgi:uncharacterized membrane protein YqjE
MADSITARIVMTAFLTLFFSAFGLYHLMVFRVNRHLDFGERFPHTLSLGQKGRLKDLYKSLDPRSPLYELTILVTMTLFVAALVFVGLRIWGL